LLKRFGHYFLESNKDFYQAAHVQRITPPASMINIQNLREHTYTNTYEKLTPAFVKNISCPFNLLSKREISCFALMLKGYSYVEIGEKFSLSPKTVNAYFSRIKQKLDCTTKYQLIEKARKAGVVEFYLSHLD
jgi:DNA-binding CsgD family transcriptional regulator